MVWLQKSLEACPSMAWVAKVFVSMARALMARLLCLEVGSPCGASLSCQVEQDGVAMRSFLVLPCGASCDAMWKEKKLASGAF